MEAKTFKRRDFIRAAAVAATGVLAAACQPKVVEVEKVVKETVIVAGTPQVVEKTVKEVVKETVVVEKKVEVPKGVKITMYHAWHRAIAGPVIEPMVREFEATHPGIFIALTGAVPAELGPMIMAAVAAGTPPSITWGSFAPLYRAGAILPIDEYLQKYNYEVDQVYQYLWDMFSIKGKKYAFPVENSSVCWWYNKDLLEKAGLPEPKPDWDWNDLVEYAKKLTIYEKDVPVQYGITHAMDKSWAFFTPLMELGGQWMNDSLTQVVFDSEAGVKAMTWFADLCQKEKVMPEPGAGFNANDWFPAGKCAMQWDGPWRFGAWVNELNMNVGTVPHPKNPDTGNRDTYVFGGTLQLMKTNPEEQDAAAQFLCWFHSRDNNTRWCIETGYLPMRKDVAETPKYKDFLAGKGKVMKAFLDSFTVGKQIPGRTVMPKFGDTQTIFADECWDPVLTGKRSPQEGLKTAAEKINADKELFERIDL